MPDSSDPDFATASGSWDPLAAGLSPRAQPPIDHRRRRRGGWIASDPQALRFSRFGADAFADRQSVADFERPCGCARARTGYARLLPRPRRTRGVRARAVRKRPRLSIRIGHRALPGALCIAELVLTHDRGGA